VKSKKQIFLLVLIASPALCILDSSEDTTEELDEDAQKRDVVNMEAISCLLDARTERAGYGLSSKDHASCCIARHFISCMETKSFAKECSSLVEDVIKYHREELTKSIECEKYDMKECPLANTDADVNLNSGPHRGRLVRHYNSSSMPSSSFIMLAICMLILTLFNNP